MKVTIEINAESLIKSATPSVEQVCRHSAILSGMDATDRQGDLVRHLIDCVAKSMLDNIKRGDIKLV